MQTLTALRDDASSAWRGVRARGSSGLLVMGLLALAIAGNVVMFAFADSLVFRPVPFPEAHQIYNFRGKVAPPERADMNTWATLIESWSRETDLLSAVAGVLQKTVYLKDDGPLEPVRTLDVTTGFFKVLGVQPRWGRDFQNGDELDPAAWAVVVSESLARKRFGNPAAAVGQRLQASAGTLVVVGVMDASFVYPTGSFRIWRALDLRGPLARNMGVSVLTRASSLVDPTAFPRLVAERSRAVGGSAGLTTFEASVEEAFVRGDGSRATLVFVLGGAALCLLLAACANVASLELANALRRARGYAIRASLGASRGRLARIATLEALMLVCCSAAAAGGLAWLVFGLLGPNIPVAFRMGSNNPIDFDARALAAMAIMVAVTAVVCAVPAILAATRARNFSIIKSDDRGTTGSRVTVLLRRGLTVAEVALAVALLVAGLLYLGSYRRLLAVEKGFDSTSLYSVGWTLPVDYFATRHDSYNFSHRILETLRATHGIEAVTTSGPPPSTGDSPMTVALEIDGQPPLDPPVPLGRKWVDREYFNVIKLPVIQGELPLAGAPDTEVVVPETFAKRFFPDGRAVGRQIRRLPKEEWLRIAAVVGDFRTAPTRMPDVSDREVFYYSIQELAPPPPAAANQPVRPPQVDTGGVTRFNTVTVRTDGRMSDSALLAAARAIEPGLPVTVSSVDESYARQNDVTRLASQIVGAFGVLSFVVAMMGVYGVMSFLVSTRTREIGVRMALGATVTDVRRLVLGSSLRMVVLGAVLGIALAWTCSRWIASTLFGVSPLSPVVYVLAAVGTVVVAVAATWPPARSAARVDPAVTLRHD